MAIWKPSRTSKALLMGRGISRRKYERKPTFGMELMNQRLNEALINSGHKQIYHTNYGIVDYMNSRRFK